jgi:glutamate carboxypeptidase
MLLIQSDEEVGSSISNLETINYICEKAKNAVAFFNTEGKVGDTVVIKRKGILRYKFNISGVALHSSRCAEASNAIGEAAYKIIELEKIKDKDGLTCNCGVISGGTTANTVAAECTFTADIRFLNEEELLWVREKVRTIAETVYVKGCTTTCEQISFRPAMEEREENFKLLSKMNEIYKECGLPELSGVSANGGSDAAYVTISEVPCVDSIGASGGLIHNRGEYVYTDSIADAAKRMASVAMLI